MGSEDGSRPHHLECFVKRQSVADEVADPLQAEESGVALVGVEHLGRGGRGQFGERLDGTHSPDTEQQLLQEAMFAAATVETVGDGSQRVLVFGDIRVEKQQLDATHGNLPDSRPERFSVRQRECDQDGGAVGIAEHAERQTIRVEHGVGLLLPALARNRLAEVASAIEESHSDDGYTEVGCALEVIAGEDAESTRVLRQRCGDSELRREIGHCFRGILEGLVPARLREVRVEVVPKRVRAVHKFGIVRQLAKPLRLHRSDQTYGIMADLIPDFGGDRGEHLAGRMVPRPAEVRREFFQRSKRVGKNGVHGKSSNCLHPATLGEEGTRRVER